MSYPVGKFETWYAWRPVWTEVGMRWLTYIKRRKVVHPDWDTPTQGWEYMTVQGAFDTIVREYDEEALSNKPKQRNRSHLRLVK